MRRAEYDLPSTTGPRLLGRGESREVLASEFSETFVQGMLDRMLVSFRKYGAVADGIHKLDCLKCAEQRIGIYLETGNAEALMDAANFLMMEFMYPKVPGARLIGTDSDQSPGRALRDGRQSFGSNEENARPARSDLARFVRTGTR